MLAHEEPDVSRLIDWQPVGEPDRDTMIILVPHRFLMGGEHALRDARERHPGKSLQRPSLPLVFFLDKESGRRCPERNDEIVALHPDVESAHLIIGCDGETLLLIEG